jgi:hypothetical protein
MVANNTREGQVLERLLAKLEKIREQMGDDRVYDVIQDVLEDVSLDEVMDSVFNGKRTALDDFLDKENNEDAIRKIKAQKDRLAHSEINYADARELKENSDEKRLQPIYIQLFFEKAFRFLGGKYSEVRPEIFRIEELPEAVAQRLRADFKISSDIKQHLFCFDKQVFLDYQRAGESLGKVHYINPGNPVFDSLVKVIRERCREDALKGTVLISPDDREDFFAFLVKSQITDSRTVKGEEGIADERLALVAQGMNTHFKLTSPAKFLDLHAPNEFAKPVETPNDTIHDDVVGWSYEQLTEPQLAETQQRVIEDTARRKAYLSTAFDQLFLDLTAEINELQGKVLITRGGDNERLNEKIARKQNRIEELKVKKRQRLEQMEQMQALSPRPPEILGCAYVVPLSQVEYQGHYGMSRDDEAEAIAMATAMAYEKAQGWTPEDVSANNEGYDIRSISPEMLKRYIEVKGRSGADGSVMLSENEMNRLSQLGDSAWLYIVINCKSAPELFRVQNPAQKLRFEKKSKGVQYFLPMEEWKRVF